MDTDDPHSATAQGLVDIAMDWKCMFGRPALHDQEANAAATFDAELKRVERSDAKEIIVGMEAVQALGRRVKPAKACKA